MSEHRDPSHKRRKPAQTRRSQPSPGPRKEKSRNAKTPQPTRKKRPAPKTDPKPLSRKNPKLRRKPASKAAPRGNLRPQERPKLSSLLSLRLVVMLELLAVVVIGVMLFVNRVPDEPERVQSPDTGTVQATTPPTMPPVTDPPATEPPTTEPTATEPTSAVQKETEPDYVPEPDNAGAPTTVIHLAAAGDLNINDATVAAGRKNGSYDYTDVFLDVAPIFAGADLAVLNLEGSLVGNPYGTQSASAPQELAKALDAMGVDLVQVANSYSITHGIKGLTTTLNNLRDAGLEPLGAYASAEEFQRSKGYTIVNVKGIRIAFVAFTKGVGGLSLPAGSEDCVNLLYTDYATTYQTIDKEGINKILKDVALEKPDLTIAMVHWGSEYKDEVTKNQKKIADILKSGGVDVILGTHSHMLHQIDFDPVSGQMVAYSLGDFFGDADRAGTEYSVILNLEITRDNASGNTRVTSYTYTPIYTLTEDTSADGQTRVVRLAQAMAAYDENFVGKVSQTVYESMEHAKTRIDERINPKK